MRNTQDTPNHTPKRAGWGISGGCGWRFALWDCSAKFGNSGKVGTCHLTVWLTSRNCVPSVRGTCSRPSFLGTLANLASRPHRIEPGALIPHPLLALGPAAVTGNEQALLLQDRRRFLRIASRQDFGPAAIMKQVAGLAGLDVVQIAQRGQRARLALAIARRCVLLLEGIPIGGIRLAMGGSAGAGVRRQCLARSMGWTGSLLPQPRPY